MVLDKSFRHFPVLAHFVMLWVATGLLLTAQTTAQADEPTKRAALVIQREYLKDRGLKREIDRYIELVQLRFDTILVSYPVDSGVSPVKLREGLKTLHSEKAIQGAFLIGQFQFPTFHNECCDESTMFAYYSDLDGQIEDRNGDGKFDFYDPWLDVETDEKPVHELWIAVLRPYFHHQRDFRSLRDIQAYFRKVNEHLEEFKEATDHRAAILTSKDWPQLDHLHTALRPIYSDRVEMRGGYDSNRQAIATNPIDLSHILAQPSEICFLYVHSGSSQHVLDAPAFPGNCVLPGVLDAPGRVLLESLEVKPRILSIWGCHALDVQNVKYMNNRFLADSYLFTPSFSTQTLLGSSRSIGLEQIEVLIPRCQEQCLADAWLDYMNHCYSEKFLKEWLGVRGVWEKERLGFDWGYCIYGNPFDQLGRETPSHSARTPDKRLRSSGR